MSTPNDTSPPPPLALGSEHVEGYEREYRKLRKQVESRIAAHNPQAYADAKALLESAKEAKENESVTFRALLEDKVEKKIFNECLMNRSFPPNFTQEYIEKAAANFNMDAGEFRKALDDLTSRFQEHKQETREWISQSSAEVEALELAAKKALYATSEGKALLQEYYDKELGYMLSKWGYFPKVIGNVSSVPELLSYTHSQPNQLIEALSGSQSVTYDWQYLAKQAKELSVCTGEPISTTLRERMLRIGIKPEFAELYSGVARAFEERSHEAHLEALYTEHKDALDEIDRIIHERIDAAFKNHSADEAVSTPHNSAAEPRATQVTEEGMSWLKRLLYSEETGRVHTGKAAGWAAAALAAGASAYILKRSKEAENDTKATWAERSAHTASDTSKGVS